MVLASCAASAPTPTPPIIIVEDAGDICFSGYDLAVLTLIGTFTPAGCFSTNCTALLETRFGAPRFPDEATLRFSGRFVLRDTTVRFPVAEACRTDCKGAGIYPFTIGGILTGTPYAVWLGARQVGTLTVTTPFPPTPRSPVCFR
jgi:hypothetical protein